MAIPDVVYQNGRVIAARELCRDALDNPEYVRGVAELLLDTLSYAVQDGDKEEFMRWLVTGSKTPPSSWLVVAGNPLSGFKVYGSLAEVDWAIDYAETNLLDDWWVTKMEDMD